jgi:hypothetical protein
LTPSALTEYRGRLAARASEHARLARLDARISYARLAIVAAGVLTGWLGLAAGAPPAGLAIPAVAFAALAVWHDRVLRALDRSARAIAFYQHGIARLEDAWERLDRGRPRRSAVDLARLRFEHGTPGQYRSGKSQNAAGTQRHQGLARARLSDEAATDPAATETNQPDTRPFLSHPALIIWHPPGMSATPNSCARRSMFHRRAVSFSLH